MGIPPLPMSTGRARFSAWANAASQPTRRHWGRMRALIEPVEPMLDSAGGIVPALRILWAGADHANVAALYETCQMGSCSTHGTLDDAGNLLCRESRIA